jgi:hypothetical protein
MPFPGLWGSFDRILIVRKQSFSMSKFTICLQFTSTKWAKAYLINYIILEKLQESMGNMILCSLSWITTTPPPQYPPLATALVTATRAFCIVYSISYSCFNVCLTVRNKVYMMCILVNIKTTYQFTNSIIPYQLF